MNSSNPDDFQKVSVYRPPPSNQPAAIGIPANSTNHFYTDNQQAPMQIRSGTPVPWSTGLCGCFEDVPNCCITCWCPCISFGQIAEIVDKGSTSCGVSGSLYALITWLTGCGCCYSCLYRSKMRNQYMLHESPCNDCLVHCFCEECALCQEYRELKNRGFDMTIGWEGNVQRQNGGVAMAQSAPVMGERMSR
ncbi:hypothetical protein F0562_032649 [Nyssa sinensis]|uniref:Uncharacterized protein n=1 Tax=Nyssa sinensis TaxID=561372 RepID=A0A5J5AN38_9ASTE|nr:hypothetical protein F0562_032649 [Nyssa sinensis]